MKRFLLIFIAMVMAVTVVGCGSETSKNSASGSAVTFDGDSSGGSGNKPSEPERTYKTEKYSNPLRFHKRDGSEYLVTAADPDVYRDDASGYFYMYCTNTYCEMGSKGMQFDRGPIFRSKNLVDWTWVGSVFADSPDALSWHDKDAGVWAPSVIKVGNRYNYYYSLSLWGDDNPGIGVATAPTPYGPWTHYGKLLDSKMTGVKNGIDPQPFYDGEQLYIIWGSFFGIACTPLTDDGTEVFYGDNVKEHITYLIADNTDGGMDIDINYEGSYVVEHDGKLYYFGSQGTCLDGVNSTYRVRAGVADKFLEPFKTHDGKLLSQTPYGEEVISPSDKVAGVGHNTVVVDFAGNYWLFYHGFDIEGERPTERIPFMDKILWDENGMPYVEGRKASVRVEKQGPVVVNF